MIVPAAARPSTSTPTQPPASTAARTWLAYVRVSTDEQAREGVSLAAQELACRQLLGAHGHGPVETVIDGGWSGKSIDRPGMQQVLSRLRAGTVAGVVVYALDRLTRRLRDLLDILDLVKAQRAHLISVRERIDTSGPMGDFMLHIMGAVAQLEHATIVGRVLAGMEHRRAQGAWQHKAPMGALLVRDEEGVPRLVEDPATAPALRVAARNLREGSSLVQVAEDLNTAGCVPRGGRWEATTLRAWLARPSIVGPVLTAAEAAAALRAVRARRNGRREDLSDEPTPSPLAIEPHPLAGLCWCSECGAAMVISTATGAAGTRTPYLRCSGRLKRGRAFCTSRLWPARAVESAVVDQLIDLAQDGSLGRSYAEWLAAREATATDATPQAAELTRQADDVRARIARVLDAIEGGSSTAGAGLGIAGDGRGSAVARAAGDRLSRLQAELDNLEARRAALLATATIHARDRQAVTDLLDDLPARLAALKDLPAGDRRTVLHGLLSRITLGAGEILIDLAGPSSHRSLSMVDPARHRANGAPAPSVLRFAFAVRIYRAAGAGSGQRLELTRR